MCVNTITEAPIFGSGQVIEDGAIVFACHVVEGTPIALGFGILLRREQKQFAEEGAAVDDDDILRSPCGARPEVLGARHLPMLQHFAEAAHLIKGLLAGLTRGTLKEVGARDLGGSVGADVRRRLRPASDMIR